MNVTNAVGTELIGGVTLAAEAVVVTFLIMAVLVTIGVFADYPITAVLTVTGAVVGADLAMGDDPAWSKYRQIVSLQVLTPLVGGDASYATARLFRIDDISERWTVSVFTSLVSLLIANMELAELDGVSGSTPVIRATAVELTGLGGLGETGWFIAAPLLVALAAATVVGRWVTTDKTHGQRRSLLVLDGFAAFSVGDSQVGLAVGSFVPLLDVVAAPLPTLLIDDGLGLFAGS